MSQQMVKKLSGRAEELFKPKPLAAKAGEPAEKSPVMEAFLPESAPALHFDCAHCGDKKLCDCRACTLGRLDFPLYPCSACEPEKRKIWLEMTEPGLCPECHGTGICHCVACWGFPQNGQCIVCRPVPVIVHLREALARGLTPPKLEAHRESSEHDLGALGPGA